MAVSTRAVIIDYGSGNLRSAAKAFERAARDNGIDATVTVTADAAALRGASHIVLPGVGAFADCKRGLAAVPGMIEALEEQVIRGGKPFLGICVGMQLMADRGLEFETSQGLGWIPGDVVVLKPSDPALKVPHMGWNDLEIRSGDHPVLAGISTGDHAYFVHSYQLAATHPDHVLASVDYGGPLTAMVGRDNLVGTQFHPEKSQEAGLRLIANFLGWRP
ncbi:MAG: imidazole glycerol phosphate synthase subunit HisH [Alphaproteobacteria bacterium]|nr:imidazole glycerol phosphate synthase subunit HisH [Alphaproteobacteria bacterium]MBU0798929.1 imidazole glycerol phosphate synthase subunit HisH [Alphaproteobacteria bacterium]MBU0886317.1 imidazole glycerol phosphate synthase subunit HisH [Alphaproteobacteria bacterium]MBU1813487.1 imidazole glycerol phosphate synthase subunit HisH [Alphaproteobacteria bacterium]